MRIITGTAKGCHLKTPGGMSTRPTSDRVKESLFSILGREVLGKKVLDIFAGTGALGLEALSRGAEHCVFIDKATADIIRFNSEYTKLADKSEVVRGDAFTGLNRQKFMGRKFDLVFCDPPYHMGLWEKTLQLLDAGSILMDKALVVVECGGDENQLPELKHFRMLKNQRYGKITQIFFLEYSTEEIQEPANPQGNGDDE